MSKNPAFQFYPGDYLSSQRVSLMTLEEEGAYIRLLCYCWKHGHIPADPEQLAILIGKGATVKLATKVSKMFLDKGGGRLVHDKLEELRVERNRWIEKSRRGGLKTAENRRKLKESEDPTNHPTNHPTKGGAEMVDDCLQPKGHTSSSSSSSFDTHTIECPSKKEVVEYANMIGLPEWKAEDWWLDMESKGWKYRGDEIVKWQAFLARVKKWWESDGRPMQPGVNNRKASSKAEAEMPDWKKVQVLQDNITSHPGNTSSTYYRQGDQKAKDDFLKQKRTLRSLKEKETERALE